MLSTTKQHADVTSQISIAVPECTSKCPDPTDEGDPPSSKLRRSHDIISLDDRVLVKRDGNLVNAHNVEKEMAFISQPRNKDLTEDFVYDDTAGTGQTIYVIDTGAGLANTAVKFLLDDHGLEPNNFSRSSLGTL